MRKLLALPTLLLSTVAHAQAAAPAAVPGALDRAFGAIGGAQGSGLSLSLQLLLLMGLLTILPGLLLMMTSFTRILVVLSILRQALGLQQSPPNQVLIGLALFLSLFVMAPTLERVAVGVVIGIVQAATSINEQTLTFVPKLAVTAVVLVVFGASMMGLIGDFMQEIFAAIAGGPR